MTSDEDTRQQALESLEHLQQLEARKAELYDELHRSLLIQQLWPEAFDHGTVSSAWMGPREEPYRHHINRRHLERWRLRVTNGAGEQREFPLAEVPEGLHNDAVRRAVRHQARRTGDA